MKRSVIIIFALYFDANLAAHFKIDVLKSIIVFNAR